MKNNRPDQVWVCWSFDQACYHIEDEAEGIATNLCAFLANRPVSFIPIATFATTEAACAFANSLQTLADDRARERARQQERQLEALP